MESPKEEMLQQVQQSKVDYEPIESSRAIDLCAMSAFTDDDTDQSTPDKEEAETDSGDSGMMLNLLTIECL